MKCHLAVATCALGFTALTQANIQEGLVLNMPLDEGEGTVTQGMSENSFQGTLEGEPEWVEGKFGRALRFQSQADSVAVEDNAAFHIEGAITQAAWVKLDRLPGAHAIVFGAREGGGGRNIGFGYGMNPSNGIKVWTNGANGGFLDINDNVTQLETDTWYYLAYTHTDDDNGKVKIYVDGELTHEQDSGNPVAPAGTTGRVTIGTWTSEAWPGAIDEVRLWNRALSQEEIRQSMTTGPDTSDPGLSLPARADLGQVPSVPSEHEGTVTISNPGASRTLEVTSWSLDGPNKENFTVDLPQTFQLGSGESRSVTFIYRWTEAAGSGLHSAVLSFESNDAATDERPNEVELVARILHLGGPGAQYAFDGAEGTEVEPDAAGFGRDGTLIGAVLGQPGLTDETGTSVQLPGSGYLRVPSGAFDSSTFTVMAWVHLDELPTADPFGTIFALGSDNPVWALLVDQGGALSWFSTDPGSGEPLPEFASETKLAAGTTYHVAAKYSAGNVTLYIDGAPVASKDNPWPLEETPLPFFAGAYNGALPINGRMDDLQYYTRALADEDVKALAEDPGSNLADSRPIDSDGDGLSDAEEESYGTHPLDADSDDDGLQDGEEAGSCLDPNNPDTDGGGIPDGFELSEGTDGCFAGDDPNVWVITVIEGNGGISNIATAQSWIDDPDLPRTNAVDVAINFTGNACQGPRTDPHGPVRPPHSPEGENPERYVVQATTVIGIKRGAVYKFGFGSDDGGWIDLHPVGNLDALTRVAEFNANRPRGETTGEMFLTPGNYRVNAYMWENGGGDCFDVFWNGNDDGTGADGTRNEDVLLVGSMVSGVDPCEDDDGIDNVLEPILFGGCDETSESDFDNDGLTNGFELANPPLDPTDDDTDDDGAKDGDEVNILKTNPTNPDSDRDGLIDGVETNTGTFVDADDTGTDPNNRDTDGDGSGDGFEVTRGTDPTSPDATGGQGALARGIVAYWRFEEGAGGIVKDESGNGVNGEIDGGGDGQWVDDPERGSVLDLAGTFVDFGEFRLPGMDTINEFTWSFWANSAETDNNNIVFGNRWSPEGADFQPREFIKFTPRTFEWHFNNGGENHSSGNFETDVWEHHLVVKAGDQLLYYRNGDADAAGTITGAPENPQPFYIGGQGGLESWSGLMDEAALWSRALSEAEVSEVFSLGQTAENLLPTQAGSLEIRELTLSEGAIGLSVSGEDGASATIQYSEDLIDWIDIGTATAGSFEDTDVARTSRPAGFYRASH